MFSFSSFLTSRRGSVDMTWVVIIGIAMMVIILSILFPTLLNAARPLIDFKDDCSNFGGILINVSENSCNGDVAMASSIVNAKEGFSCCVKKPGVPQEYFDVWKHDPTGQLAPEEIDAILAGDSPISTPTSQGSPLGAVDDNGVLIPFSRGSLLGTFYSRQRNNEHFCFLAIEPYVNPDAQPFTLLDVVATLAWGDNIAACTYEEDIVGQTSVDLNGLNAYSSQVDNKAPCLTFILDSDELILHLSGVENSLPVLCDTLIVGEKQKLLDTYLFTGTTTCKDFSVDQCVDYSSRPKNTWFSLNCVVDKSFLQNPKCQSCSGIRSCKDYDLQEGCVANQCLVSGDFAYEDTDCFWLPKNSAKPDKGGNCLTCESCGNYDNQENCHGARDVCKTNCVWSTTREVCELS